MGQSTKPDIEVLVTISEEHLPNIKQLVSYLQDRGLKVSSIMENIGIVSGTVSIANLQQLKSLNGITAVEEAGKVQLPPPNSDVQ